MIHWDFIAAIAWYFDLHIPMQLVPITALVVREFDSHPWRDVLNTTLC
jgi:hypothetical protein